VSLNEFSLIQKYFSSSGESKGVTLGVGDDCAILDIPEGKQLVATVDTLVEGVHFPVSASPADIAHRSLRVNLSDIAAMGADPHWFTLALTLPKVSESWLCDFSQALLSDALYFGCSLVGGDTTAGPLSITMQVLGTIPIGSGLTRGGCHEGDSIYVTGSLGEGAAALALLDASVSIESEDIRSRLLQRFYRPEPRLKEGACLRNVASAAIDISDGLIADLGHIGKSSGVGANIEFDRLPVAPFLLGMARQACLNDWILSGGDDYELCFTVPRRNKDFIEALIHSGELNAFYIGEMCKELGVRCYDSRGQVMELKKSGYRHF